LKQINRLLVVVRRCSILPRAARNNVQSYRILCILFSILLPRLSDPNKHLTT
jgi:hypothetical protein